MKENQIEEARNLAPLIPHNQSAADTSPWMVAQYIPDLGTGGTAATIAYVQASSMTFTVDAGVPAGKDAIGASGVILTSSSTYNTMGELVDAINGYIAWRAYLVGALRADLVSGMLAKTAASCLTDNGLTFYGDTSINEAAVIPGTAGAYEQTSVAISGEKFENYGVYGHKKDADDLCENSLMFAQIELAFSGVGTLRIYSAAQNATETQLYGQVLTTATAQDLGIVGAVDAPRDGAAGVFLKAKLGERLIIRAGTLTAFSAWTQFNIVGQSAVLNGSRIVTEDNY